MTKHGHVLVVVDAGEENINVALKMAAAAMAADSQPMLLPPPVPVPVSPTAAEYIAAAISRKKLLEKLEVSGGARMSSWVEAMKASSPTHLKAVSSLSSPKDDVSWIVSCIGSMKLIVTYLYGFIYIFKNKLVVAVVVVASAPVGVNHVRSDN